MPFRVDTSTLDRYCPLMDTEPYPPPYIAERRAAAKAAGKTLPLSSLDEEFPPRAFPTSARNKRVMKKIPDIFSAGWWPAVSEDLRALIERLDPGIHQFSPEVEVFYKDGRRTEKKYFCLNTRRPLFGSIIVEQCNWHHNSRTVGTTTIPLDPGAPENRLMLDADVIAGRHFWRAGDYYDHWFVSDEFAAAFKKAKLITLNFYKQPASRR